MVSKKDDPRVRQIASRTAIALSGRSAKVLETLLTSENIDLVEAALTSLGDGPDSEALQPSVLTLLRHDNTGIRLRAVAYLQRRLDADELEKVLKDYHRG